MAWNVMDLHLTPPPTHLCIDIMCFGWNLLIGTVACGTFGGSAERAAQQQDRAWEEEVRAFHDRCWHVICCQTLWAPLWDVAAESVEEQKFPSGIPAQLRRFHVHVLHNVVTWELHWDLMQPGKRPLTYIRLFATSSRFHNCHLLHSWRNQSERSVLSFAEKHKAGLSKGV